MLGAKGASCGVERHAPGRPRKRAGFCGFGTRERVLKMESWVWVSHTKAFRPLSLAPLNPRDLLCYACRTPAKEARCWQTLECNVNIKVIKDEARKHGCPDSLRSVAWYVLSGAAQIADAAETAGCSYTTLAASTADLPDEAVFAVEDEVRLVRTAYAERRLFTTAKSAEALSRMVFAYMQRNPTCGYVKGLVHIAALVLSVFGKDEEKVSWLSYHSALMTRSFSCSSKRIDMKAQRVTKEVTSAFPCHTPAGLLDADGPAGAAHVPPLRRQRAAGLPRGGAGAAAAAGEARAGAGRPAVQAGPRRCGPAVLVLVLHRLRPHAAPRGEQPVECRVGTILGNPVPHQGPG